MNRIASLALLFSLVVLPAVGSADYLYRLPAEHQRNKPYVLLILDTSNSMVDNNSTDEDADTGHCPYGFEDENSNGVRDREWRWVTRDWHYTERCYNRLEAAQSVALSLLPKISADVELGVMTYTSTQKHTTSQAWFPGHNSNWARNVSTAYGEAWRSCGVKINADFGSDQTQLASSIEGAVTHASIGTPLAWSILKSKERLLVEKKKAENGCRDFYILLLTDGDEWCAGNSRGDINHTQSQTEATSAFNNGIRTFVVGFGKGVKGSPHLSALAQKGGTSLNDKGEFVCWQNNNCGQGTAMFAAETNELEEALTRAFEVVRRGTFSAAEPVIATVPQEDSEIDRVARNMLVYPAFHQDAGRMEGHLFGFRLFKENGAYTNDWQFSDMDGRELLEECGPDRTCLFDAGRMLQARTKPRVVFTAKPATPITEGGAFRIPLAEKVDLEQTTNDADGWRTLWWSGEGTTYAKMPYVAPALKDLPSDYASLQSVLTAPSQTDLLQTIGWLHGEGKKWKLADMYHASPAIVEPPSLSYLDRGYPQFRRAAASRPWMIYIGANDGMIHAFHASPDFDWEKDGEDGPRWQAGEEAWAFLPVNMWARTLAAVKKGDERFYSQDLSCRFTDVLLDDKQTSKGLECGDDPYCGWGTVLMCGQGWGGSWFVALDITDPFDPKPLWEFTIPGGEPLKDGDAFKAHAKGLGRTWSVPAISLTNNKGKPTWIATFGNGYNSSMQTCTSSKCNNDGSFSRRSSYRILNMPFEGPHPEHGIGTETDQGHAFIVDVSGGSLLKTMDVPDLRAVVADIATVDANKDGLVDAAYFGGMNGNLARVAFGDVPALGIEAGVAWCSDLEKLGNSKPITSNPSVVAHPTDRNKVYLFMGTGLDAGSDPDQQSNQGKMWEFHAFAYNETGAKSCNGIKKENVCSDGQKWKLDDSARLLGQPLFSRQLDGRDFVLYSTWSPTKTTCSTSGVAHLHCLDVTSTSCKACGDLDGDGTADKRIVIDTGGVPPTSPVIADGHVYVGYKQVPIKDEDGNTVKANVNRSRTVTLSWREVF